MFRDTDADEFVEIYNNSGSSVSLTGWAIDVDGSVKNLTGTIGANSYLIVTNVSGPSALSHFNINTQLGFTFAQSLNNTLPASLSNTSSTIKLTNSGTQDEVTYSNTWGSSGADGTGKSLELNSPANDNSSSSNWAASPLTDGSFGGRNAAITCFSSTCNGTVSNLTSSIDLVQASGSQTIESDLSINQIFVSSGATLNLKPTGNTGHHFQLAGTIENNGTFLVGNNCTVLQTSTSSNSGSGSYKCERLGDNDSGMHNTWGSPVSNANILTTFASANPCDVLIYSSSAQKWMYDYSLPFSTTCNGNSVTFAAKDMISEAGVTADGVFDIGRGYFAPGSSSLTLRTFSGSNLNNGTITEAVTVNGTGAAGNDDWNLIGNPYMSGIDANAFVTANSNIQAALYFWNPSSSGVVQGSDYKVWTTLGSIGGTINGGSIVGGLSGNHIAACQGFFVEANSGGNITFNNTMRTNTSNQFYKTEKPFNDNIERVWLSVKSEDKKVSRQILFGFADDATDNKDRLYDAIGLEGNPAFAFYSHLGKEKMAIQGIQKISPNSKKIMPVGFNTKYPGMHSIQIDTTINWINGMEVFIHDKEKNQVHNLKNGKYFFYSAEGRFDNRFNIVFKNENTTSISETESTDNKITTRFTGENWLISSNKEKMVSYELINVAGMLIENKTVNQSEVSIQTSNLTSGVYFLKIKLENNREKVINLMAH